MPLANGQVAEQETQLKETMIVIKYMEEQGFDLSRLNNADVLFSYREINSYSLVKAIKYEFSLYSYC